MTIEGQRHTLIASKVTENMNLGVHVVAKNEVGEDTCKIDVRMTGENDNNDGDDDSGNEIFYRATHSTQVRYMLRQLHLSARQSRTWCRRSG